MDQIGLWFKHYNFDLATSVATVAIVAAAALGTLVVKRLLRRLMRPAEARIGLRSEEVATIVRIVGGTLWFITLLVVLQLWHVDLGGLWALLVGGATIIGVGFLATWAMVSNITASLLLVIWRPFRLGDTVELLPEKFRGRAVDSNLMFTMLHEEEGSYLQIPNNLFFQKVFRVAR